MKLLSLVGVLGALCWLLLLSCDPLSPTGRKFGGGEWR